MVVYKSSTSLSGLCKSDGYLKCGTLVKREGCVRDVPKSEHAIFLHPDTTEYKEKASELEEVMSVKNISLSVLCQFANSSIPNISQWMWKQSVLNSLLLKFFFCKYLSLNEYYSWLVDTLQNEPMIMKIRKFLYPIWPYPKLMPHSYILAYRL